MGSDYYNHTAHLSIHEAGCIAHVYWLNHTDYCCKALGWLLMRRGWWMMRNGWQSMAYNEVIVGQ